MKRLIVLSEAEWKGLATKLAEKVVADFKRDDFVVQQDCKEVDRLKDYVTGSLVVALGTIDMEANEVRVE